MILIDRPNGDGFSHMVASSLDELHDFANHMGVKRCWFENKRGKNQPHYDIHKSKFHLAVQWGATVVTGKEIVEFLKMHYDTTTNKRRNHNRID